MYAPETTLKLASSASEQNVYFTYVCLVNEVNPNSSSNYRHDPYDRYLDGDIEEVDQEDVPIQVERSKAVHELVETRKDIHTAERSDVIDEKEAALPIATSFDDTDPTENEDPTKLNDNPNILKLTKMKWLTEEQNGSPDSSSTSLSPNVSSTSICSRESDDHLSRRVSVGDRYLSTILRLDREHNLFGLSSIAIIGSQPSRRIKKDDDKPVFPQTAIVCVCCGKGCCRHRSKTDLPSSLKCGGCRLCCASPICYGPCGTPCTVPSPCPSMCSICPKGKCSCKTCLPLKCLVDCTTCYGIKVSVNRKPKYEPSPVELTPRSSCVLKKPYAARSCHHLPRCVPPSSCFPYLMPCFWPARPSAPCSVPTRCFHNPPCIAPRRRRPPNVEVEVCPPKCEEDKKKCKNQSCPGNSPQMKQAMESRFGKK